jgi:hypothetical protein
MGIKLKKGYLMEFYKSMAWEKYKEYDKKTWLWLDKRIKLKWWQKLQLYVFNKFYRIKDYYTNPYRIFNRKINKLKKGK